MSPGNRYINGMVQAGLKAIEKKPYEAPKLEPVDATLQRYMQLGVEMYHDELRKNFEASTLTSFGLGDILQMLAKVRDGFRPK